MGNLYSTMMAGLELSINYDPLKGFIRGFKAMSNRNYGGEDLGRTGYIEAGLGSYFPLTPTLSMKMETYATWADREDMMSRFGVTRQQSSHSQFHAHQIGGGLKSVSLEMGLNWQQSENITFSGGVGLTALTSSDVRDSPITQKNVGGVINLSTMYTF
ncbi:MipA/OmpV family protein [Klebsiella oxytoca]